MKLRSLSVLCGVLSGVALSATAATSSLLGWNNLGMHCMDRDFSVFSVLPPYNTVEAQLIVNGQLVKSGSGYTVTYQAIADPDGSINTTSIGKGDFYDCTSFLYGSLAPDAGLAGWGMPGINNTPQTMLFEVNNQPAAGVSTPVNWFRAEGIPITPYDDAGRKNPYPLMRLTARDSANNILATSDVVLPVSDEMDCRACHASGSTSGAQPFASGWVYNSNPELDYRLNILRLHDDMEFSVHNAEYKAALAAEGFNPNGLYANVATDKKGVLCAACHASEALGKPSYGTIPALTTSIHSWHAHVQDPQLNTTLDNSANRAACYRCHPGSETKCLRGAMGSAVASDGSMEMQCQSCHGTMSQVGDPNRVGWFMEPNCQSCHTGTATHNNGQIRYTSVFDTKGNMRTAVDQTFATTPNTPASGLSLYRFSVGHGGLQCEACHGSTHAEFPSSHRNDNLRNIQLQGHVGMVSECTACHTSSPSTVTGGPHGMHPVGQTWVSAHQSAANGNQASCQPCHGTDYRGTVLSRALGDRTLTAFGTQNFFRGATIGCYTCHNGPSNDGGNTSPAPSVSNVSVTTAAGQPVTFTLPASGNNLTLRIISQPANGTVGLANTTATYYPDAGFSGTDTFTFAAYDGSKNSTLATGTIAVGAAPPPSATAPTITTQPVSQTVNAGATVNFSVTATGTAPLSYQWRKNTVNIAGATASSLTLNNVSSSDAASYAVLVSNSAGSVLSSAATLTVLSTPPSNMPPVVQILQPGSGSVFKFPAQITLTAQASDPDGSISRVSFYSGSTLIGRGALVAGTVNQYTFVWNKMSRGTYSVTATATDNLNATTTSAPVTITVARGQQSYVQAN